MQHDGPAFRGKLLATVDIIVAVRGHRLRVLDSTLIEAIKVNKIRHNTTIYILYFSTLGELTEDFLTLILIPIVESSILIYIFFLIFSLRFDSLSNQFRRALRTSHFLSLCTTAIPERRGRLSSFRPGSGRARVSIEWLHSVVPYFVFSILRLMFSR